MFSELAVGYLFLGGAGAGGCAVAALLSLLIGRDDLTSALQAQFRSGEGRLFRAFLSPLLVASLGALLVGVACLLADLGQPARLLLLAFSGKITHLTVGAWALVLCAADAALLLLVWRGAARITAALFRAANGLLLALALVVALYTGLLLSSMTAVPLWSGAALPALFLVSALSCGLALAAGLASVTEAAAPSPQRCTVCRRPTWRPSPLKRRWWPRGLRGCRPRTPPPRPRRRPNRLPSW